MPDDTLPPTDPHDLPTLPPDPPANDAPDPPIIRAGEAQAALSRALTALVDAFVAVESVGMAIARQLDSQVEAP
jgi:hypothetical protein